MRRQYPAETLPTSWFDQTMRWANLTLVQDDPGKYDPQFWLDYIERCHCDAASWNSGGIIAFYPTQIPFHRRNIAMGDTDPFGILVEGCRQRNIIVTARVDHHATYDDAAAAHPEWISENADGTKRRHWAAPDLWVTCAFGPYNYEFMTSVIKEIVTLYGVDGFNQNRWHGSGTCFCQNCRRSFEAFCGRDEIPRTTDLHDPAYRDYRLWHQERLFELWDLWDGEIRKINPKAGLLPGMPGGVLKELDLGGLRKRAHTLYLDHQGRSGNTPPWSPGRQGKQLRAVLGRKPVGLTFSVGTETRHRWKDSVQTNAEVRLWVAEGVANGLRPKFCKFSGYLHDARWLNVVEEMYTWQWKNERYLRNEEPLARVAVLHSQQTERSYRAPQEAVDAGSGLYQALLEARIPFEMVNENLLGAEEIDQYKLIILPNCACLTDSQCEQIRQYVARGGSIVATLETSLYNEWGERRDDFALADLFGVSLAGPVEGPMKNAYLRLEHDAAKAHPILRGLEDAPRIIHGVYRQPVTAHEAFSDVPVTLIPAYPDLPMEEVYPRADHTGIPEIYLRQVGETSRVAYIPWDIDRVFWEIMAVDHGKLLANIVDWAANESAVVTVEGKGIVDVTVWRQTESMTVHLVNLTNPMFMKGPFREILPISSQQVSVKLPDDAVPKAVRLLSHGEPVEYVIRDGYLRVTVPSIDLHEVVAVDL